MGIIPQEFTRMIQIPISLVIFFVAPSLGVPALNSALGNLFPNLPSNLPFQPPTNGLPLPLQQLLGEMLHPLDNCLQFYKQLLQTSKQPSREQQQEDLTYPVFLWTCLL